MECIKKSFGNTIEYLNRLENYEQYRLKLSQAAKRFFESTAAGHGFASSRRYLNFMNALFPPNAETLHGIYLGILEDRQLILSRPSIAGRPLAEYCTAAVSETERRSNRK